MTLKLSRVSKELSKQIRASDTNVSLHFRPNVPHPLPEVTRFNELSDFYFPGVVLKVRSVKSPLSSDIDDLQRLIAITWSHYI